MKVKGNAGKLFMLRMEKAIDQTRLFSEVGHNPKIRTCFFLYIRKIIELFLSYGF